MIWRILFCAHDAPIGSGNHMATKIINSGRKCLLFADLGPLRLQLRAYRHGGDSVAHDPLRKWWWVLDAVIFRHNRHFDIVGQPLGNHCGFPMTYLPPPRDWLKFLNLYSRLSISC